MHLPPEESLIKPEDLAEIESFKTKTPEHITYIVNKVEQPQEDNDKKREPFKPYRTTKSDVHDPEKEKLRKQNKHWEVTAATPPLIVHGAVKVINLTESLQLQKEQTKKLQVTNFYISNICEKYILQINYNKNCNTQEIQAKHAAERLADQFGLHNIGPPPENVGTYRLQDEKESNPSISEDEENEVYDDEDNDKAGTVVFTVDSIES